MSTPLGIVEQLLRNPLAPTTPSSFYMRFMEGNLAAARSFHSGDTWTIRDNPDGTTIEA